MRGDERGLRILVVEDSVSARKLLQGLLVRLGVGLPELRLASTVTEALQLFTAWHPNVVFLDLQLHPPLDSPPKEPATPAAAGSGIPDSGAELAKQLLSRNPSVKIVVCSATDPTETSLNELVRQKKIEVIVKPILAARVQEILAKVAPTVKPAARRG